MNKSDYSLATYDLLATKLEFYKSRITLFSSKKLIIDVPEIFSIIDNPNESIRLLGSLFRDGMNSSVTHMEIVHNNCLELGLDASLVMDIILMAIKANRNSKNNRISYSGTYPRTGDVKDILEASGAIKHLGAMFPHEKKRNAIKCFSLRGAGHNSMISDKVSTELVTYFDKCLETQRFTITDEGKRSLGQMLGEVINNCELHAGSGSTWYTIGHYKIGEEKHYGQLQLVFLSFGDTICESFSDTKVTLETKAKLEHIIKQHKGQFSNDWNRELLTTLFSLQEGISRFRDKHDEKNRKRGSGTVDMIENFLKIGKVSEGTLRPIMVVTSGHAQMIFDGTYQMKDEMFNDEFLGNNRRKIIAFNDSNNIFQPPDKKQVKIINEYFPGTIISLRFYLDGEYMKRILTNKLGGE